MSKAAELAKAGETLTNQPSGRKNIVTNGAMQVAQRSTSETGLGAAAGYFTLDRWKIDTANSAGRFTMTQTADGPTGISANCLKLDCTTADASIAAAEYLVLFQHFEGQDLQGIGKGLSGAKEITLSFYVKASAAFTFGAELYDQDNGRQITKLFDTTTGWVRHEFVIPADPDDGSSPFGDDNLSSLTLHFWIHAGSNFTSGTLNTAAWANNTTANRAAGIDSFYSSTDNEFFLTGVQLEIGSQATNFEHRSFGEELALCQRYFYVFGGEEGAPNLQGYGKGGDNTFGFTYPTNMRASPSGATSGTWQKTNCGDPVLVHQSSRQFSVRTAVASEGAFEVYPSSGSGKINMDAEL